jgi:low temperature requirement protein LtrA
MSTLDRMRETKVHAPEGQSVTFVELFFDLVFVFALTQITSFAAHNLDAEGVLRATVMFWLIWWGWTQWTWALNAADTEHGIIRIGTLVATAIAFIMAVSVGDAFEGDGGLWFIVPYILVRALGLTLYARVAAERDGQLAAVQAFALLSLLGLAAALIGGIVNEDARVWLWLSAIGLDVVASGAAGRFESWHLHTEHLTERHGLFVIIALGESLIVAATAITGAERSAEVIGVAIGAVAVTCLLWWIYFGWLKDSLEARLESVSGAAQARFARDAYSLLHFFLIGGIVGVAVAFEEMAAHPAEAVPGKVLIALAVGIGAYLWASAAIWARGSRGILWARLLVPAVLALVLIPASDAIAPWTLAIVAAALAIVVLIETIRPPASIEVLADDVRADAAQPEA